MSINLDLITGFDTDILTKLKEEYKETNEHQLVFEHEINIHYHSFFKKILIEHLPDVLPVLVDIITSYYIIESISFIHTINFMKAPMHALSCNIDKNIQMYLSLNRGIFIRSCGDVRAFYLGYEKLCIEDTCFFMHKSLQLGQKNVLHTILMSVDDTNCRNAGLVLDKYGVSEYHVKNVIERKENTYVIMRFFSNDVSNSFAVRDLSFMEIQVIADYANTLLFSEECFAENLHLILGD